MASSCLVKNGNSFEIDWLIEKMLIFGTKPILSESSAIEGSKNIKLNLKCVPGGYNNTTISLEVEHDDPVDYLICFRVYCFGSYLYNKINSALKKRGSIKLCEIRADDLQNNLKGYFENNKLHVEVFGSFTNRSKPLFNDAANWGTRLFNHSKKDYEFTVFGNIIKVHKLIVSAESTVLNDLFQNASGNHLDFPEFKFETVKAAVDYCYAQDISSFFENDENAIELLTFADKYNFQTLKPKLENYLCKKITPKNVGEMVKASSKTNSKNLWQACVNFVRKLLNNNSGGPIMDISTFDGQFLKEILQQSLKP